MRRIAKLISAGFLSCSSTYVVFNCLNPIQKVYASTFSSESPLVEEALRNYRDKITEWDFNWDGRNDKKGKATRYIFLIRHGQYHMEKKDENCHLTMLGHQQTDLTGKRLAHMNYNYTKLIYSTMTRARESAQNILKHLKGLPSESSDLIREGAPFPPEPPLVGWPDDPMQFITEGVRIEKAFRTFFHRADPTQESDSYEIFVCHANVIRYFVCRALQLPPEAWLRMSLDNGSITMLVVRPTGTVSIRCLGSSAFMPHEYSTVN
ncbi:Serine/threonine-protein phosphatase pgam5, mitochondrial [Cichlidogyrus casuarinus]|uniref:Serine/threonine-protein phosphatase PGAM5, mitochondrial n=1 Tax=Cichlidogyrus casuarinus TaxID=1844966 RepID=A0ABD2Q0M8_9PLAT